MDDSKTQHGEGTAYSIRTRHKYPFNFEDENQLQLLELFELVNQLYPTGRAWYMPENGVFENLHKAFNINFFKVIQNYKALFDSSLPDNDNFTQDDASFLEFKYGLITNELTPLDLRKKALLRKIGRSNNIRPRQSQLYIQQQLNEAGFEVFVHANEPPYQSISELLSGSSESSEHGDDFQHGGASQHGGTTFEVVANSINQEFVSSPLQSQLWATFFIGGENLGETANVPEVRRREFRELILKLKPAQLYVYLLINYN